MTDDPDTPIAIVGADAHPIAIKARKPDGKPVVCLVVGSHQGLLQYGVMQKAIEAMIETYDINVKTIQIDIGPGLSPDSISGYDPDKDKLGNASYEVGMDLAKTYIKARKNPESPYYGKRLKFFDASELKPENFETEEEYKEFADNIGSENPGSPIFRKHPSDTKKCVIDIEALVQQTAALSGVKPENIVSVEKGNFFSARGMVKQLDLAALAQSHAEVKERAEKEGISAEEFLAKNTAYRNDGMGRNFFIARVLPEVR
jgi:hypothetical protein